MTRTLLFDVDQTLLWSGGAGGTAMRRAFDELYSVEDGFRRVEFSGRTDQSILRQALVEHGVLDGAHERFAGEMARFKDAYFRLLAPALDEAAGGTALPGIAELLARLAGDERARIGLATGNFRNAAFMKLHHFGIGEHLTDGAFADDSEDRSELVGIAIERIAGGRPDDAASVWIIGDTPLDIAAAQANGARSLGVATGSSSQEELHTAGADATMPDLSDTERALEVMLG